MKKFLIIITVMLLFLSCKELKRNNPYDPASENYIKITYKGDVWYPPNTEIKSIIINNNIPVIAANKTDGPGYCIIKLYDRTAHIIGSTGSVLGTFTDIIDICSDSLDNIYIVDSKPYVQVMDKFENFTWWSITYTAGIGTLGIECFNNNIFITNNLDNRILKYQNNGVFVDSKIITATANGLFTPGRIFKSSTHLFIVNQLKKTEIIKMDENLNIIDDIIFRSEVIDGVNVDGQLQLLTEKAIFRVDNNMVVLLKWGDFGEGPGRVLNGKLITFNPQNRYVYVLDGETLKMFGE